MNVVRNAFSVAGLLLVVVPAPGPAAAAGPTAAVAAAPAHADPPPWAPAHGRRRKDAMRYRYYPGLQVYFDVTRRVWFSMNVSTGAWTMGATLPIGIAVGGASFVELDMTTSRPYLYHEQIIGKYPPPARRPKPPAGGGAGNPGGGKGKPRGRK